MDKEITLIQIESVLPKIQQYITYKEVSFEPDELTIIKDIAARILPGKIINWSCSSCGGEVIDTIWAYYHREKNIF